MLSGLSDFQMGTCFRDLYFDTTADAKASRVRLSDLHRDDTRHESTNNELNNYEFYDAFI